MNRTLLQSGWKIAKIIGIPIKIHFSWIIVFGLITWSLSSFYFPKAAPDLPVFSYWIKGVIAALLLFVSVAFHELAHSFVAKKYKITIESITLFIFGGVAQMKGEPPSPRAEFWIAVAGPLSSFILAILFFFITLNTGGGVKALFSYLTRINLILGLFNLIPGFPMDGGRVLRSILWQRKKNFFYATQKAANVGQKIALFFIFLGIFSIFGGVSGGLWLMLIGWFLYSAAQASYQQSTINETLYGIRVKDIMIKNLITVSPDMTVEEVINDYFLKYGFGGFPVVSEGKYLGIVTLREIKDVPKTLFKERRIGEIYLGHRKAWEISPEEDVIKALEKMIMEDAGRLVILEGEKIVGLITRNGIGRYIQILGK